MTKRKPTGFVATCQCGVTIGALDYRRIGRAEAGRILGRWLMDGCTVEPRFNKAWSATIQPCRCDDVPVLAEIIRG